ncbi:TIGR04283 family arsenosugar biosynthesis glycosyltransferase [Mongoliitalea lutea]|uniref:Glycosyl hydrolase n=1 Tax=Mongoliitalea lutea TaxID=849756 RepID=A0A8J3D035_9BACT|nr:TIGR04283 family arsenosugar biosynthesis glycosyltransferase [Mongoliitalea lutea]GHB49482.1 glycosyl hydrolase [Mongoliitalea lutea]
MSTKISLIIPVYNEEKEAHELIAHLEKVCLDKAVELIIVDGGSTDQTMEIFSKYPNLKLFKSPKSGRAAQMNYGASQANGEVLYFVHADTRIVETFFEDILDSIKEGFSSGCYAYSFDSNHFLLKINSFFTKFNGVFAGGGDQTLFITKQFFNSLNGFNEAYSIMEDFELTKRIRKGHRFKIINKKIKVSARKYIKNGWLKVQLVNLYAFVHFYKGTNPDEIKTFYKKSLEF